MKRAPVSGRGLARLSYVDRLGLLCYIACGVLCLPVHDFWQAVGATSVCGGRVFIYGVARCRWNSVAGPRMPDKTKVQGSVTAPCRSHWL